MLIGLVQKIACGGKHLPHVMGGKPAGMLRIDARQLLEILREVLIPRKAPLPTRRQHVPQHGHFILRRARPFHVAGGAVAHFPQIIEGRLDALAVFLLGDVLQPLKPHMDGQGQFRHGVRQLVHKGPVGNQAAQDFDDALLPHVVRLRGRQRPARSAAAP